MINWLFINQGKVVAIVQKDDTATREDYAGEYDTVAQDDSATFQIGDNFLADLQLEYNRTIWTEKGWLAAIDEDQ
jgi:hypothetical protein